MLFSGTVFVKGLEFDSEVYIQKSYEKSQKRLVS